MFPMREARLTVFWVVPYAVRIVSPMVGQEQLDGSPAQGVEFHADLLKETDGEFLPLFRRHFRVLGVVAMRSIASTTPSLKNSSIRTADLEGGSHAPLVFADGLRETPSTWPSSPRDRFRRLPELP
jgi:hypothetical protein